MRTRSSPPAAATPPASARRQLSSDFNYKAVGDALGVDLLHDAMVNANAG
ncbi:hypothetical protein ACFRKB_27010 [Streptomyces scopuliridis]